MARRQKRFETNMAQSPRFGVYCAGLQQHGIHEVTGSIPVWSTTLRSPKTERATGGKPTFAQDSREGSNHSLLAQSADTRRVSTAARRVSTASGGGPEKTWQFPQYTVRINNEESALLFGPTRRTGPKRAQSVSAGRLL